MSRPLPSPSASPPDTHDPAQAPGPQGLPQLKETVEGLKQVFQEAVDHFPGPLCDRCLGRMLGRMSPREKPEEKGKLLREALVLPTLESEEECGWCEGLFQEASYFAGRAKDALASCEFHSFLVATRMHPDVQAMEQKAQGILEAAGFDGFEPLKMEFNRNVGALLHDDLQVDVDLTRPDAIAQVDPFYDEIQVTTSSLFLYGRYRKLVRTIPQTRWPCRSCKGSGCGSCEGTGQKYPESVESLVSEKAVEVFRAQDSSFHGAGREDIDALMLGTGRPFVLELKQPRWRTPRDPSGTKMELDHLESVINEHASGRAQVMGLRWCEKADVARVKNGTPAKAYRAHVTAEQPVTMDALVQAVEQIAGKEIAQRTPNRVAHRRADKIRHRLVHDVAIASFAGHADRDPPGGTATAQGGDRSGSHEATRFSLDIHAAAGTYIKELVSSDEGRTQPSFAELLGVPMKVEFLDVVSVGDPFDSPPAEA